ncbi:MAG: type II secretion system F family protein [Lachnospiraceae bacterium]|nr:type II secretion system F family protein [Lachnospiraceae bacterium]
MGCGLVLLISWLFYKSYYGLVLIVPEIPLTYVITVREYRRRIREKIIVQFREMMRIMADSLEAGFSLERTFAEAEKELGVMYDRDEYIMKELKFINCGVENKVSPEKSLLYFTSRIGDKNLINFANIMSFASRSGGNYVSIIRNTIKRLEENAYAKQEIESFLADRVLEAKVMCVMPLGIIAILRIQSGNYLAPLYGNIAGIRIMTFLLVIYGIAVFLSFRISKIEVG